MKRSDLAAETGLFHRPVDIFALQLMGLNAFVTGVSLGQVQKFAPLLAMLVVSACGDPLAGIERLSDVTLPQEAPTSEIVSTSDAPVDVVGFFGRIFGSAAAEEPVTEVAAQPSAEATDTPLDEVAALELPVVPEPEAASGGGFMSWLDGFVTPATQPAAMPENQIALGTVLPYGEIAVVCGLSTRNLGREIETVSGYTIYDTAPTSTGLRTQYITGFSDGCARQFTGTLALFGDIGTHEFVRYGEGYAGLPYTQTDEAYEAIKADFCRVSRGQPCGSRIDRLSRRTTFLTIYERFGGNGVWVELLLHNGAVVAQDFEGNL